MPRRSSLSVLCAIVAACGPSEPPLHESDPLAGYSAAARANPSPSQIISGVSVWNYCNSLGYPTVGYRKGRIQGPRAAYDNWVCQRGTEQMAPTDSTLVDMDAACRWHNRRKDVVGRPSDPDHAWSWNCHRDTSAAVATRP